MQQPHLTSPVTVAEYTAVDDAERAQSFLRRSDILSRVEGEAGSIHLLQVSSRDAPRARDILGAVADVDQPESLDSMEKPSLRDRLSLAETVPMIVIGVGSLALGSFYLFAYGGLLRIIGGAAFLLVIGGGLVWTMYGGEGPPSTSGSRGGYDQHGPLTQRSHVDHTYRIGWVGRMFGQKKGLSADASLFSPAPVAFVVALGIALVSFLMVWAPTAASCSTRVGFTCNPILRVVASIIVGVMAAAATTLAQRNDGRWVRYAVAVGAAVVLAANVLIGGPDPVHQAALDACAASESTPPMVSLQIARRGFDTVSPAASDFGSEEAWNAEWNRVGDRYVEKLGGLCPSLNSDFRLAREPITDVALVDFSGEHCSGPNASGHAANFDEFDILVLIELTYFTSEGQAMSSTALDPIRLRPGESADWKAEPPDDAHRCNVAVTVKEATTS